MAEGLIDLGLPSLSGRNYMEDFLTIPLTMDQVALVDASDFPYLMKFNWHAKKVPNGFYASRSGSGKTVRMHRELMGFPENEVDHINGNPLDNRRSNLRLATVRQNRYNSRKRMDNTSGFKGVYKQGSKWNARISVNSKLVGLGTFKDKESAYKAYCAAAIIHAGIFARLA